MKWNGTIIATAPLVSGGDEITCYLKVERGDWPWATATVENVTGRACQVVLEFQINGTVPLGTAELRVHLPLTANGLFDHHALKSVSEPAQLTDCEQALSLRDPQTLLLAHYLEPAASHPSEERTRAPLLIPLVEWFVPGSVQRFAMFASPERAWRFSCKRTDGNSCQWSLQTLLTLQPGESRSDICWLLEHLGGTREAWRAFHQFARVSDLAVPDWLRQVRVHYFDFLSADRTGRRGSGFDHSAVHFRDFSVGLATQHGYYPF